MCLKPECFSACDVGFQIHLQCWVENAVLGCHESLLTKSQTQPHETQREREEGDKTKPNNPIPQRSTLKP